MLMRHLAVARYEAMLIKFLLRKNFKTISIGTYQYINSLIQRKSQRQKSQNTKDNYKQIAHQENKKLKKRFYKALFINNF